MADATVNELAQPCPTTPKETTSETGRRTRRRRDAVRAAGPTPDAAPDLVVLEKHRFEDLGDGRTRLTATSLVDSFEVRDAFLVGGMAGGVDESYVNLDRLPEAL